MTSPISFVQPSYYNLLNRNNRVSDPILAAYNPAPSIPATNPPGSGTGNPQLSPEVQSALQQILSAGGQSTQSTLASLLSQDANPLSQLLGGTGLSTANPLTGSPVASVVQQVYSSALQAANNATLHAAASSDLGSKTVQNALAAYQSVIQASHPNPVSTTA